MVWVHHLQLLALSVHRMNIMVRLLQQLFVKQAIYRVCCTRAAAVSAAAAAAAVCVCKCLRNFPPELIFIHLCYK